MNLRHLVCALFFLLPLAAWAQLSFGTADRINDGWVFRLADDPAAREPGFNDQDWEAVQLPHDWSVRGRAQPELASCTGYLPGGIGWYRKKLLLPEMSEGERVYVYFEGVYNRSEVYLNGHLLGKRPNGYVSFYYDATPHVRLGEVNTLAVRVDHSRSADSRWYTGSGIYRNVYLVRAGAVHLAPWGLFARPQDAAGGAARLLIDAPVQNHGQRETEVVVSHELVTAHGTVVGSASERLAVKPDGTAMSRCVIDVPQPHRWSVDNPYLYQLRTTLSRDGQRINAAVVRTGIRTFAFSADKGFFLNGVSMKMKGVCLHHDAGVLGAAVPREVWKSRLQTLKELGCNAVRTSHNPQAPDLYDLCDELGLLVLDEAFDEWEFPKRKWLRGWNVGEPGFEGSSDFFEEWGGRDVADMVRRDRNHPSIFAWSIGNEVDYPNDPYSHPVLDGARINQPMFGGYKPDRPPADRLGVIAKRLVAEVKRHDDSRPATAALAGVVMSNQTEYPAALDLAGYNYTEDRYSQDHDTYPGRILYGSENGHSLKAWRAVQENDYIFGQFLWTGIDYLGEAGPWPSRGFYSGLIDLSGAVKPRGRFREALWSAKPVIHLGTELVPKDDRQSMDAWPIWNYPAGARVRVLCYTNAAKVRLVLNGEPTGPEKGPDPETGVIAWDVDFAAGTLEALAFDAQGGQTGRSVIMTAGPAAEMRVTADTSVLRRRGDVTIISLQTVDRNGTPVMDAEHEVACRVEGPARLLGLEAGNNRDMSDTSDAVHRVFHGRIVAYVQATGETGPVRVRFASDGLPEAQLGLPAE